MLLCHFNNTGILKAKRTFFFFLLRLVFPSLRQFPFNPLWGQTEGVSLLHHTTAMLLFTLMSLSISLVRADQKRPSDLDKTLGEHLALGQLTLNEMFKEVEKLMEDTQQKLEEAVHQVGHWASHTHCRQDSQVGSFYPFSFPVVDKWGLRSSDPPTFEAREDIQVWFKGCFKEMFWCLI